MTSNFIEIQFEKIELKRGAGRSWEKRNSTTDGPLKSCFLIIDVDDAFLYVKKKLRFPHFYSSLHKALLYNMFYYVCVCVLIDVVGGEFKKLHPKCIGAVVATRRRRSSSSTTQWKAHLKNPLQNCAFFILQLHWFSIPKVLKLSLILSSEASLLLPLLLLLAEASKTSNSSKCIWKLTVKYHPFSSEKTFSSAFAMKEIEFSERAISDFSHNGRNSSNRFPVSFEAKLLVFERKDIFGWNIFPPLLCKDILELDYYFPLEKLGVERKE